VADGHRSGSRLRFCLLQQAQIGPVRAVFQFDDLTVGYAAASSRSSTLVDARLRDPPHSLLLTSPFGPPDPPGSHHKQAAPFTEAGRVSTVQNRLTPPRLSNDTFCGVDL